LLPFDLPFSFVLLRTPHSSLRAFPWAFLKGLIRVLFDNIYVNKK